MDKEVKGIPSTEDNQIDVTSSTTSTKDEPTEFTPFTGEEEQPDEINIRRFGKLSVDSESSFTPKSISTTDHGMSPPVPSSCAMKEQTCVLSIEGFTFHKLIAQGGFGKVVLATHPAINQKLAVKVVKKMDLLHDFDVDVASAFTERDVLKAGRKHPCITHLYGTFQEETLLFYVMEFLSGGDLKQLISTSAPLDEKIIRNVTAEIVCGLQFLHSMEIVHRDIKPDNILFDDIGHIKIADFGNAAMGVTESNMIKGCAGTPFYMAPEMFLSEPYFGVADYYSLGVIVYEMALGKHPFCANQNILELDFNKLETATLETTPFYPEDMNMHLCNLINRLLEKRQELRWYLISDIRDLPFFMSVNWKELEERESPSPLKLEPVHEQQSHEIEVSEFLSREDLETLIEPEEQENFYGFSYIGDSLKLQPMASSPP